MYFPLPPPTTPLRGSGVETNTPFLFIYYFFFAHASFELHFAGLAILPEKCIPFWGGDVAAIFFHPLPNPVLRAQPHPERYKLFPPTSCYHSPALGVMTHK